MSTHNVCFDEVLIVQEQETEGKALKKNIKRLFRVIYQKNVGRIGTKLSFNVFFFFLFFFCIVKKEIIP